MKASLSELHISSLLIHASANAYDDVVSSIQQIENVEVHSAELADGKIIALLETEDTKSIRQHISTIEQLPGVMCVAMVYHHCESAQTLNEAMI